MVMKQCGVITDMRKNLTEALYVAPAHTYNALQLLLTTTALAQRHRGHQGTPKLGGNITAHDDVD